MPEEEDKPEFPVDRAGREIVPGVDVKDRKKPARKPKADKKVSAPAKPVPVKTAPVKRYSFVQWAARNGVPAHHRGGLRAFVTNVSKHRTLEEWDKCFEGY